MKIHDNTPTHTYDIYIRTNYAANPVGNYADYKRAESQIEAINPSHAASLFWGWKAGQTRTKLGTHRFTDGSLDVIFYKVKPLVTEEDDNRYLVSERIAEAEATSQMQDDE